MIFYFISFLVSILQERAKDNNIEDSTNILKNETLAVNNTGKNTAVEKIANADPRVLSGVVYITIIFSIFSCIFIVWFGEFINENSFPKHILTGLMTLIFMLTICGFLEIAIAMEAKRRGYENLFYKNI